MTAHAWSVASRLRWTFGLTAVGLVLGVGLTSDWWLRRSSVARLEALAHEELDEFAIAYEVGVRTPEHAELLAAKLQSHHEELKFALTLTDDAPTPREPLLHYDPHGMLPALGLAPAAFPVDSPRNLGDGRVVYARQLEGGHLASILIDGAAVLKELRGYESTLLGLIGIAASLGLIVAEFTSRRVSRLLEEVAESARCYSIDEGRLAISSDNPPAELREVIEALAELSRSVQSEVERGRVMTAGLAHELRAPIQNLLGEAEVALMSDLSTEEYRATLQDQLTLLHELADSVDNLVTLCREGSSSRSEEREDFDLRSETDLRKTRWERSAARLGVGLEIEYRGELRMHGDREATLRALRNLIANAVNASPAGETVEVRIEGEQATIEIEVSDRGPGIPIADRERVFEPFHRGSTPAGRRAGYGLGLALVRAAALQHGGAVQIADRDGSGTRITLTLRRSRSS